jgi:hypothetical protein
MYTKVTLSRHGHPYLRKKSESDLIGIERIDLKEVHIHSFTPILEGILAYAEFTKNMFENTTNTFPSTRLWEPRQQS